ncbi:MAG: ABC transporter ATP-binding protein [Turneriella sp.]|nr:ABC transporter ATP-binding protein [Turneriella sp.]
MKSDRCVIKVENLHKEYQLGEINHGVLYKDIQSRFYRFLGKEDPNEIIGSERNQTAGKYSALAGINLEIFQGESVGIIGRNGAGKSTLLKILSRVTSPTKGKVSIQGKVASLLEVGTGFHPELSGRENVYLNGAILGLNKKQISALFDEIVAFSGIEKYIETPVKRYSSGMYVRLAFSVAAFLQPEILIVDEVLAVGDVAFQKKCINKMTDISRSGKTIIFVSHSMESIMKLCERAIVLDKGKVVFDGLAPQGINKYLEVNKDELQNQTEFQDRLEKQDIVQQPGFSDIQIRSYALRNETGDITDYVLRTGKKYTLQIRGELANPNAEIRLGFGIFDSDGRVIFTTSNADYHQVPFESRPAGHFGIDIEFPAWLLSEGDYFVELLGLVEKKGWYLPERNSTRMKFKVFYSGDDTNIPLDRFGGFNAAIKHRLKWRISGGS